MQLYINVNRSSREENKITLLKIKRWIIKWIGRTSIYYEHCQTSNNAVKTGHSWVCSLHSCFVFGWPTWLSWKPTRCLALLHAFIACLSFLKFSQTLVVICYPVWVFFNCNDFFIVYNYNSNIRVLGCQTIVSRQGFVDG